MRCELTELYVGSRNRLINRVSRAVGGKVNAEDVVQEAFGRSLQYEHSFDPSYRSFTKWFNTILNNCVHDFRKQERLGGMVLEDLSDPLERTAYHEEMVRKVLDAMSDSPAKEVLSLYFIKDMDPGEIAEVTDLTPRQVSHQVYTFQRQMRAEHGENVCSGP